VRRQASAEIEVLLARGLSDAEVAAHPTVRNWHLTEDLVRQERLAASAQAARARALAKDREGQGGPPDRSRPPRLAAAPPVAAKAARLEAPSPSATPGAGLPQAPAQSGAAAPSR